MSMGYKTGLLICFVFAGFFLFAYSANATSIDATWVVTDGFEIYDDPDLIWDNGVRVCVATLADSGGPNACTTGTINSNYNTYRVQVILKEGSAETGDIVWSHPANDSVAHMNTHSWAGPTASSTACKFEDFGADDTAAVTDCSVAFVDVDTDTALDDLKLTCSTCGGGGSPKLTIANDGGTEGFMYLIDTGTATTDSTNFWRERNGDEQDSSTITITATAVAVVNLAQTNWKWFANAASTSPAVNTAAAINQPITLGRAGFQFRLRLNIHVYLSELGVSGTTSKMQFATTTSVCDTGFSGETYTDIYAGAGFVRYYDNTGVADNLAIGPHKDDPRHASTTGFPKDTLNLQNYNDGDADTTFTNAQLAIPQNEDGLWDFSFFDAGAPAGTRYCFRAVDENGGQLFDYGSTTLPEIRIAQEIKVRLRGTIRLRTVRLR